MDYPTVATQGYDRVFFNWLKWIMIIVDEERTVLFFKPSFLVSYISVFLAEAGVGHTDCGEHADSCGGHRYQGDPGLGMWHSIGLE